MKDNPHMTKRVLHSIARDGLRMLCRIENTKRGVVYRCGECLRGKVAVEGGNSVDRCRVCKAKIEDIFVIT